MPLLQELTCGFQADAAVPTADDDALHRVSLPLCRAGAPTICRGSSAEAVRSEAAPGDNPGATWSIEVNIGSEDPVTSIMLHLRGGGNDVLTVIAQIADALGARVLDVSTGEFLTGTTADAAGWRGFQQYRDQVPGP